MFWLLHYSLAHRNIYVTEVESDIFPLRYYLVLADITEALLVFC